MIELPSTKENLSNLFRQGLNPQPKHSSVLEAQFGKNNSGIVDSTEDIIRSTPDPASFYRYRHPGAWYIGGKFLDRFLRHGKRMLPESTP